MLYTQGSDEGTACQKTKACNAYDESMPEPTLEPEHTNAPPDKPAYRPFPEVARAIRAQSSGILGEWRTRTLVSMPELAELTVSEFMDDIARILAAMADALESNDPPDLKRLIEASPAHGFHRLIQDYSLLELFAEERVLRRVIVSRVEESLARRCSPDEAAALHSMIDIMLQQGVLALVQQQNEALRQGAEDQIKHLSFLSHDLSNTFFVMRLNLEFIQHELSKLPQMNEMAKVIGASLEIINRTRSGMRRLLDHERLRKSAAKPHLASVTLLDIVEPIVTMAAADMRGNGRRIAVSIDPSTKVSTNADLLTVILQNLIGNAVKHSSGSSVGGPSAGVGMGANVRVKAERGNPPDADAWIISVTDDGPGIPQDQLETLFNAFERLPQEGETAFSDEGGYGLGLAIASQAARLLGSTIEVTTHVGEGSRFSLRLPAPHS